MNRIGVVFGVATLGTAALAAEFTFIGDENASWTAPSSYQEERVPSAGDTVTIAKNCTGVVTDANFDFVASLGKIVLKEHGELRFDVTGEKDFPVPAACFSTSSRTELSRITKNGSGVLGLSGGKGDEAAYRADLVVNEGNLKLYPNETSGVSRLDFNGLIVASNATLTLPPGPGWTRINGQTISVAGTIHCPYEGTPDDTNGPVLQTRETAGEISGRLTGNMIYRGGDYQTSSKISMTGTNNTIHSVQAYSYGGGMTTIGFKTYGAAAGDPSSIGTKSPAIVGTAPGRLLYLGDGETTTKSLNWGSTVSGCEPATFDAGAHGGFTFEEPGEWFYTSSSRMNHDIIVTGSNAVECCWNGRLTEAKDAQGNQLSTYIIKRGTGTWHFGHNIRKWNQGVIAVEDGTLKFDTIFPAGQCCSLGRSNRLRGRVSLGEGDTVVPYAFLLGGEAGSSPVFEYSGTTAASCDTRPIGVRADATFANGTDYNLAFTNVFGVGEGAKTLTLAGESTTAVNTLTAVTNACGKLSIAKDGAGTWTLDKAAPNGSVAVHAGTLVFRRPGLVAAKDLDPADVRAETTFAPTWYRLTIKQNYQDWLVKNVDASVKSAGNSRSALISEFALYDKDGKRLNKNFTYVFDEDKTTYSPITKLQPNEVAIEYGSWNTGKAGRDPNRLTDGNVKTTGLQTACDAAANLGSSDYMGTGLPKSWQKFVMRLPEGSPAVAAYDYANDDNSTQTPNNRQRQVYAYSIEASMDGVNWIGLEDVVGAKENVTAARWNSDDTVVSHDDRPGCGYAMDGRLCCKPGESSFDLVESVSVDAGATLKADCADGLKLPIKGLTVDPAKGAGTIDGFAFAETGTFNLTSLPPGGSKYRFTLRNCTGFENVADWSVRLNGQETGKYEIVVSEDGSVTIVRKGALVIIR